jgi:polyisoprenoid-binding protein YceI
MTRTLFALATAALLAASAPAADTKYPITGDNTKLEFVGTKPDGKHEGGFKKLNGTATVTDGKLETLKIEVEIDCDSLYSDEPQGKLTAHLKSPDFFAVKDHPKATFKTTKVEKTDKGYTITGDLTMLGKTKSVTFPASVGLAPDAVLLSTSFMIDRTDWGMNYGKDKIDDKVTIKIAMTAKK